MSCYGAERGIKGETSKSSKAKSVAGEIAKKSNSAVIASQAGVSYHGTPYFLGTTRYAHIRLLDRLVGLFQGKFLTWVTVFVTKAKNYDNSTYRYIKR